MICLVCDSCENAGKFECRRSTVVSSEIINWISGIQCGQFVFRHFKWQISWEIRHDSTDSRYRFANSIHIIQMPLCFLLICFFFLLFFDVVFDVVSFCVHKIICLIASIDYLTATRKLNFQMNHNLRSVP